MDLAEVMGNRKVAFAIFVLLSILFLLPVFSNISYWGDFDWDQHLFYHGSARESILKFGQFPLWNPFYCGGTPLLANPQSAFLSPFFLFVLFFGTVAGLKIEALAFLVLGLFGMFLLARKMGIKVIPAYVSAVAFMLGSWFSARVLVGHTTFFPFALVPWAVFFFLESYEKRHYALFSASVLAVMLFSGGVYPLYFAAIFLAGFALMDALEKQEFKPILLVMLVFVFAVLFSAVKLVPMLEYTSGLSYEDVQYNSPGLLLKSLFSWNQGIGSNDISTGRALVQDPFKLQEDTLSGKVAWGWHEYSSYIGIFVFLLSLLSVISYRKSWKLLVLAAVFLVLSMGDFSIVPVWNLVRQIPILGALHGPSRLLIMFAFCIALLAGRALSDIKQASNRYVSLGILLLIILEMFLVSRPLLYDAFSTEPLSINTKEYTEYVHIVSADKFRSQYPNMLQNMDTVNCYERIHPVLRAVPQFYDDGTFFEGFIGNAYIAETNQTFNISYFSPNKVVIGVSNVSGTLVYNENYLPGWQARGREAVSYAGLIAAKVTPSDAAVEFQYSPLTFYIGLAVSIISLLTAAFLVVRWRQYHCA